MGVEERAEYYDKSGALRDMIQNHVMQIVSLLTMDAPASLNTDEVRKQKMKVMSALKVLSPEEAEQSFVRGQYTRSADGKVAGYREEEKVADDSKTETYVAGKLDIENDRWSGVPVYVRTGNQN